MRRRFRTLRVGTPVKKGEMPGTGGNYEQKLATLLQRGVLAPGSVYSVDVRHDGWCAIYESKPCNCNPSIWIGGKEVK